MAVNRNGAGLSLVGFWLCVSMSMHLFACLSTLCVCMCVLSGANHVAIPAVVCGFSFHKS